MPNGLAATSAAASARLASRGSRPASFSFDALELVVSEEEVFTTLPAGAEDLVDEEGVAFGFEQNRLGMQTRVG